MMYIINRQVFLLSILLFALMNVYSDSDIPTIVKESKLFVRPDIDDLNNLTINDFFLNCTYIQKKREDGVSYKVAEHGKVEFNNNIFTIEIKMLNPELIAQLVFKIIIEKEYAIIDSITINNYLQDSVYYAREFAEKYQVVGLYMQLLDL